MGRLPTSYNGIRIARRIPYAMFAEATLWQATTLLPYGLPNQFPIEKLVHDVDKPFEIHRMIPTATAIFIADDNTLQTAYSSTTQMDYLQGLDVLIRDNAKNVSFTRDRMSMANLVRGSAAQTWEWEDPYHLTRGEGIVVDSSENLPFQPADSKEYDGIRYMLAFEGFLVVVEEED